MVDKEIKKLLELKVIKLVHHEEGEFISPIFTRPKKDSGEYQVILKELH
jgi:hypothetical protein